VQTAPTRHQYNQGRDDHPMTVGFFFIKGCCAILAFIVWVVYEYIQRVRGWYC
jgi:hypothetical protein